MTTPAPVHSGNERWGVHCPDPHPDPGCWCYTDWVARQAELSRLIARTMPSSYAWVSVRVADRLLTADTLRIELR